MTADIFDVYDEYPGAVAKPVEEAMKDFRAHVRKLGQLQRLTYQELNAGTSSSEVRHARMQEWERHKRIIEVTLFRSIIAAGDDS